jgi:nucleotide-binding universal stress UspA family protein
MGIFNDIINRKFTNLAEKRYEEIIRKYREFFLTEEEMIIPEITSILIVLDRYSHPPNENVYEAISAYPNARVCLLYTIDEGVAKLIASTLGEEEANAFRKAEREYGENVLNKLKEQLSKMNLMVEEELVFGDKGEEPIQKAKDCDLLVISKSYGAELSKSSSVSPLVYRVVQHVEKPVIIH